MDESMALDLGDLDTVKYATIDDLQEHLGASLTNLLQRCEQLLDLIKDANGDLDKIQGECQYIYDNAKHVTQLMAKCQEIMESND